jgi:hypothetical protein
MELGNSAQGFSRKEGKAGRRYEADVVKAPDWFFLLVGAGFCVCRCERGTSEQLQTQKTVTTQCEAKLAQERNGINGRGPRSGKQTVYAGFDLEQA